MKGLSKEKRDQLILTALLTVAALIGLWYGLISMQKKTLRHVAQQIVEQQGKVSNADKLVRSSTELQAQLDTGKDKLRTIEQSMASGDMYAWIYLTMNKFRANHRNVEIPQFSREVPTEAGILPKLPYKAVLFNVRGTAYYHDLGNFLSDLENSFPYMRVQNVELEPAGNSAATASAAPPPPASGVTATAGARAKDAPANAVPENEKLAFKMEIVALVNPNAR